MKVFEVNSLGQCKAPPTRPGTATLTVGRESVTLDPLLPRAELDKRLGRWDELSVKAFGTKMRKAPPETPKASQERGSLASAWEGAMPRKLKQFAEIDCRLE